MPAGTTLTTELAGCFVQAECMDPMFRQVMEARYVAKVDICRNTEVHSHPSVAEPANSENSLELFLLRIQVGYLSTLQIGLTKKPGPCKRDLAPVELRSTERAHLWCMRPLYASQAKKNGAQRLFLRGSPTRNPLTPPCPLAWTSRRAMWVTYCRVGCDCHQGCERLFPPSCAGVESDASRAERRDEQPAGHRRESLQLCLQSERPR